MSGIHTQAVRDAIYNYSMNAALGVVGCLDKPGWFWCNSVHDGAVDAIPIGHELTKVCLWLQPIKVAEFLNLELKSY